MGARERMAAQRALSKGQRMNPGRWARVKEIFHAALEREEKERPEFVAKACGADEALCQEIESLLREHSAAPPIISPVRQPDLSGQTITHYRILEKLGHGGMGVVYKAEDLKLGRAVALKFLAPHVLASEEYRTRFIQEAKALAAIDHPNICAVHEIDEAKGQMFFAMTFVDGATLKEKIAGQPLDLRETLKIAIEAAQGLRAAHRKGIVHKDIKAANIMLDAGERAVITDFGVAQLEGESQFARPGVLMGTPAYMSPEQAKGGSVDLRSDIWSLGVVLYEMLTGRLPFREEHPEALSSAIQNDDPESLAAHRADAPPELEKIVSKMLAKRPEQRYQQADELLLNLEVLLSKLGISPERPEELEHFLGMRSPRRIKLLVASAAAVLLLILVFLAPKWGENPSMRSVTIASNAGFLRTPAISPDGRQIAFGWNGQAQDNFDIYVQSVGAETAQRLTSHPATEWNPVWSPDGRFIAFFRFGSEPGAYLVPASGSRERKIADNAIPACFTPDGARLVVELQDAICLIDLENGRRSSLTFPKPPACDTQAMLSPDGQWLAFVRYKGRRTGLGDIFRIPFPPDATSPPEPEQITHDNSNVEGIAWTADGKEIVFSSFRQGFRVLWRISVSGRHTPQRFDAAGADAVRPTISCSGSRLLYLRDAQDRNIWRYPVPRRGTGIQWELIGDQGGTPLVTSPRWDNMAEYSPDGRKIAFISHRSGANEVWVCEADGLRPYKVTSLAGPAATWPRWSPDGKTLAFTGQPGGDIDVFLVPTQGGPTRRLTNHTAQDLFASWSRDGKWVYFSSNRTGRYEVWKTPADGTGGAIQVTLNGGYANRESTDGRFLYFIKPGSGLWRIPTAGGEESEVLGGRAGEGWNRDWNNWTLHEQGILVTDADLPVLQFFRAGAEKPISSREIPRIAWADGLSLSPDARWLLLTRNEPTGTEIMLIDNFR
jgi:serine/threonine protein kinase/Tol biopolymer transport system component